MRRIRKITAFLLSVIMLFPAQSMMTLADTAAAGETLVQEMTEEAVTEETATEEAVTETAIIEETETTEETEITETTERIEETLPLEELDEEERIEETLPLEPLVVWNAEAFIYWNPGAPLPAVATASNAGHGSDSADGKTAKTPVKTLAAALERAESLMEDTGVESSEITIFAMNPMEISDGELYVLNAANIRIASWPGRSYSSDVIFCVNGGQLSMINVLLESGRDNMDPEDAELILINGGTLQIGQEAEINGRIVMDYQEEKDDTAWELASSSNLATGSNSAARRAGTGGRMVRNEGGTDAFDIGEYIISTDTETTELIEDSISASTWCDPIVELMDGFDGMNETYLLEVRTDDNNSQMELVRTLYADETTNEEFAGYFCLYDDAGDDWRLTVNSTGTATVRDTAAEDYALYNSMMAAAAVLSDSEPAADSETLTVKSLVAVPLASGTEIYWNPGGAITVSDVTYSAGSDISHTGLTENTALLSWDAAVAAANGGTIICMQPVNLGDPESYRYINQQGDGSYLVTSASFETRVVLKAWQSQPQPVFIVPEGETLVLQNVVLEGIEKLGQIADTETVLSEKGTIIIKENVVAETGVIQINTHAGLADNPIQVTSVGAVGDGIITLLFGGINANLAYRCTDVVVPGGDLADVVAADPASAEAVGSALLSRFQLSSSHRNAENGGKSKFDWVLRQDTGEDDGVANRQNLELYVFYYFEAVFLNGVDGDDANDGATCQYPVKTWNRAFAVWKEQMAISKAARFAAHQDGKSTEYIDKTYPYPEFIYICDTVTVADNQVWDLWEETDYDGSVMRTEIRPHLDAGTNENTGILMHDTVQEMVVVTSGGDLTFEDVYVRNVYHDLDSITVLVKDGGSFKTNQGAVLSGERPAEGTLKYLEVTLGTHVKVEDGGGFEMASDWSGCINAKQQGVVAGGSRAVVTMNGGEVSKNNSVHLENFANGSDEGHKNGGGVALSKGAVFTMNGGRITGNVTHRYGGGVCLTDNQTSFIMRGGEISGNKIYSPLTYNYGMDATGYGAGVYGGQRTIIRMEGSSGQQSDVLISDNFAVYAYGVGIYSNGELSIKHAVINGNKSQSSSGAYRSRGNGIYADTNATMQIEDAEISGNSLSSTSGYCYGGGIYLAASGNDNYIRNCQIKDNIVGIVNAMVSYRQGGGIYVEGKLEISEGTVISGNSAYSGGNIAAGTDSSSRRFDLTISDTVIEAGQARVGGGIYLNSYGQVKLKDGVVIQNNQAYTGGAIYSYGSSNAGRVIANSGLRLYITAETAGGIQIVNNRAFNDFAGVYLARTGTALENVSVSANTTAGDGGGFYVAGGVYAYLRNVTIDGNKADNGSGLCLTGYDSRIYMADCEIINNTAAGNGGGIFAETGFYLSESAAGKFIFQGNHAGNKGGGVYKGSASEAFIDIAGDIQNSAGVQGSNLYLDWGNLYLLNGSYKQPVSPADSVYNIYLDIESSSSSYVLSVDFGDVTVEKKTDSDPKAVYLNSGNTYLIYLAAPSDEDNVYATFPIDVNKDVFDVGSVVIKPADKPSVTNYRPNAGMTDYEGYTKDYTSLKDASINLDYSSGGDLPRRTTLGGFKLGSGLTNVVLVGEGIYLSSSGDDQKNSGLTPDAPVATFKQAKINLEKQIRYAHGNSSDEDGFSPFIYICGTVDITGQENWELYDANNADDVNLFNVINAKYAAAELANNDPVHPAQVRRFVSFVTAPLIKVDEDGEFIADHIIIEGMAEYVIVADQGAESPVLTVGTKEKSTARATLKGNATIRNNYFYGVCVNGGSLYLQGDSEDDLNRQLANNHGVAVSLENRYARFEMGGYSRIVADCEVEKKIGRVTGIGVLSSGEYSTIIMKENSKITNLDDTELKMSYGLAGDAGYVTMRVQDNTQISNMSLAGITVNGENADILMKGNAEIFGGTSGINGDGINASIRLEDFVRLTKNSYGINADSYLTGKIWINMNDDANDDDAVIISSTTYGIRVTSGRELEIKMGKKSELTGVNKTASNNYGIGVAGDGDAGYYKFARKIYLYDQARIHGWNAGMGTEYGSAQYTDIHLIMSGESAIEDNISGGIYESYNSSAWQGFCQLNVELTGQSAIRNNGNYGVYLAGTVSSTYYPGYYRISLSDEAVIENNGFSGIYTTGPLELNMSGVSQIRGNGSSDILSSTSANGVVMTRNSNSSYYRSGTSAINMKDTASICGNRGGVYIPSRTTAYYPNICIVTMDGETGKGAPSIENNTNSLYLGEDATLKLKGAAYVGDTSATSDQRSIDAYGKIELDGRSIVAGRIYLYTQANPITMTAKVTQISRRYYLWLAEGFLGSVVVQPDNSPGGVTDVTDQLGYFVKDGANGQAADKNLIPLAPNIVLQGENNVYIAGNGKDTNDGKSPATPVRTFARAKELLTTGAYTSGANIRVCNSTVQISAGDDQWSFDPGGYVTNTTTGETWKPKVIRYERFKGRLLGIYRGSSFASTVTFTDIIIDGGSEEGIVATTETEDQLLHINYGGTAILGENAILQNNRKMLATYSSGVYGMGVYVCGGTLEINGGTIQNVGIDSSFDYNNRSLVISAVYAQQYNSVYPTVVNFKSGRIIDSGSTVASNGQLICLYGSYVKMTMSGGRIENNYIAGNSKYTAGSCIYVEDATFEMSGGIIRGNEAARGSAIYYNSADTVSNGVILSGGTISGNKTTVDGQDATGIYSQIFVDGYNFQIKGSGCDIADNIYLNHADHSIIKISGALTQVNRVYQVYLNSSQTDPDSRYFKKGSVVVQPDGDWVNDVTPYLASFEVHVNGYVLDQGQSSAAAGTVTGVIESECLLLMKAVFLDSENGENSRDGTIPDRAVRTFSQAKVLGTSGVGGSDYYIIYVSGMAANQAAETWSLPNAAYMCRYTGFTVYDTDNQAVEGVKAYYGFLIDARFNLELQGISIYGRRPIDGILSNGDSLVLVNDGATVTISDLPDRQTSLSRNYNIGTFDDDQTLDDVSSNGGAIQVNPGGKLDIRGGTISNTEATYGSAVYLDADPADPARIGQLYLSGSPAIAGTVYLSGTGSDTCTYVEPDETYIPPSVLQISVGNDYNGREVIAYRNNFVPTITQIEYFKFEDSITALYEIVKRGTDLTTVELRMRGAIYLDGRRGSDSFDGATPESAYRTLKKVYESISESGEEKGIVVYVVDTVEIDSGTGRVQLNNILIRNSSADTNHYEGYYDDGSGSPISVKGEVYFKRYAQPADYDDSNPDYKGFDRLTLTGSLFRIKEGGYLELNGIYLDGHSQDADTANKLLVAKGVEAKAPLVTVLSGGELVCDLTDKTAYSNGVDTATLFANNININQKTNVIGKRDTADIIEGSSAGIEILGGDETKGGENGGTVSLRRVEFKNLELGADVTAGGTDVYSFGNFSFYEAVIFGGSVFLEGFGVETDSSTYDSSCYITISKYGLPAKNDFQVLMRDPYNHRKVVYYAPEDPDENKVPDTEIGFYRLEDRIKNFFFLGKRPGAPWILELQVPVAVYVDGVNGSDDTMSDADRGSIPSKPVRSLAAAYRLLKTRAGNVIYIVDTVTVSDEISLTGESYQDSNTTIKLGSTDFVKIIRYIQPDFAVKEPEEAVSSGYDVVDFTGVMVEVSGNGRLNLSGKLYVDGHSGQMKAVEEIDDVMTWRTKEVVVTRETQSKAPVFLVEDGGILTLDAGITIRNNNNSYAAADGDSGIDGGVVYNSGTTMVDGALFTNNKAWKGSAAYQDGIFTIMSSPANLSGHTFYLTGTDRVIQTAALLPDNLVFGVDMDHAVAGRDVVRFMNTSAYTPDVDSEHEHFKPGSTVPPSLFLVEALDDPMVLELQDWEILDVEVLSDLYLVIRSNGPGGSNVLLAVQPDAAGTDLLTAPEYQIKNNSKYDVKVSVREFENLNDDAGITASGHEKMELVEKAADALTEKELYLAVKGLDSGTGGFVNGAISLKTDSEGKVTAAQNAMGILTAGSSGRFTFESAVGSGFVDKYFDSQFPVSGYTREEAQVYMDGSDGKAAGARAKYALKYKLEIDPARR